jgi:hypothetical protein
VKRLPRSCARGWAAMRSPELKHHGRRHSAKELQCLHVRGKPVSERLGARGANVGVVRAAQHGNENLCRGTLAAVTIDNRNGLPRVVDEDLLARRVILSKHQFLATSPPRVLFAEHTVLPAQRLADFVLLPQQHACHAGACQLCVYMSKVRRRSTGLRHSTARIQTCVERVIVCIFR